MSASGNVIDMLGALSPKRMQGNRRNVSWEYSYDRHSRQWNYRVTVVLSPHISHGTVPTEADAKKQVDTIMKLFCS